MYSFPVALVSAALYLVPRAYFTASQPSVNLCPSLAASLQQLSAGRRGVAPCFIPGPEVEEHRGAMSDRNSPSLYGDKSTGLKYHPNSSCRSGNKLSSPKAMVTSPLVLAQD